MVLEKNNAMQALFRSISNDGTSWLFAIRENDEWAITRNGERFAGGACNRMSVDFGIRQYLSLSTAVPQLQTAGD